MAQDVFVLTKDHSKYDAFKKKFPFAKLLNHNTLTREALEEAANKGFTKYFYVVNPDKKLIEDFNFSFVPGVGSERYVHVWGDISDVCLFNKKLVKQDPGSFTSNAMENSLVEFKFIKNKILSDEEISYFEEPDIFVISATEFAGKKFISKNLYKEKDKVTVVASDKGLTEGVLNKILSSTKTEFFYVIDSRTRIVKEFDFSEVYATKWDWQYIHVWDKCQGVRLFNKGAVESNISNFTDDAWTNGTVAIKNHEEDYFEIDVRVSDYLASQETCDIFVLGEDAGWFEKFSRDFGFDRCHLTGEQVLSDTLIQKIRDKSATDFFYVVNEFTEVKPTFNFKFIPDDKWSMNYIHIWNNNSDVLLFHKEFVAEILDLFSNEGINYKKGLFKQHDEDIFRERKPWPFYSNKDSAKHCKEKFYFVLENNYTPDESLNIRFRPAPWDENKVHYWQTVNPHTGQVFDYSGISLHPNHDNVSGKQFVRKVGCVADPYDVVFLSYHEPYAEENYRQLLEKIPHAKHVSGIKGIYEAHKAAAQVATTRMFFVVDADASIMPSFDFSFMPRKEDEHKVYVWRSKNPINNLVYGYGGVKLFPTQVLREAEEYRVDFTTSVSKDFVPVAEISNITKFNTDPFNTWKSAFRECTKLASSIIDNESKETTKRLETWCTTGEDAEYGKYAISGAIAGKQFGKEYAGDQDQLRKINDYDWLLEQFKKEYK